MKQIPILTSVLVLALAALPLAAQEPPASAFGESIEVRVVNLEAVVTDRAGHRVSGLGPEDFRLRVDGRELPIEFFTEVADGHRAQPAASAAEGARTVPSIGGVEPGQAVGTSFLVFIDDYFTTYAARRNQVLEEIAGQLSRLGPADRAAVVSFDGRKVELLSSWSRSPDELRAVFDRAMDRQARGRRIESETAFSDQVQRVKVAEFSNLNPVFIDDPTITAADREAEACATIDFIERQLERVALGVTATLRSFANPPGRKVMLLLSGGWPQSAYEYVLGATPPTERSGDCGHRGPEVFRRIYDTANLLGYTLYPVDLPGRTGSPVEAGEGDDVALPRTGPALGGTSGEPQIPSTFVREDEVHTTLHRLAVETGGRPMIDAARLGALATVIDDTRSYYWLGFTPDWQGDDRTHKVRLEVLRPGLEVRHRAGFKDLSRSAEIDFLVESALLFGGLSGARPLLLEAGPVPSGSRRVEMPLTLRIPMDEITMLPQGTRYVAELELRIGAIDEAGRRNEISVVPVSLSGDGPPPAGSYATYEFAVKIRRQPQDLVVTLHDPVGDRILAAATRLEL